MRGAQGGGPWHLPMGACRQYPQSAAKAFAMIMVAGVQWRRWPQAEGAIVGYQRGIVSGQRGGPLRLVLGVWVCHVLLIGSSCANPFGSSLLSPQRGNQWRYL